ncbi:WRKY DNA-binding protein 2 [Striga asiatica]|uniref:WRKY DNA-binding protein 2 n=1 Tax=Striga asiatica TaxID=4170 RepID=A0A5A7PJB4_STRAF|nr:WRKY DNA-binding protein 2 [Striga asiatica]
MALKSVKSIENALNLVETKKENLKKAFEELQSHASMLSSFNLTWPDIDSYFTSLQSELLQKFSTLQAPESSQTRKPKPARRKVPFSPELDPARPELRSLCENMDALGLCRYIIERPKERAAIRVELVDALKHAPDPASLILNALEGFLDKKDGSWSRLRATCTVLLEEMLRAGLEIPPEVRARAKAVAAEWKAKMGAVNSAVNGGDGDEEEKEEDGGLGRLGYLQLLATYKLLDDDGYDKDELIDYVVSSAKYRQALDLCRIIGLESKISDVILRLISKGKQFLALKFIFEFERTDEFPPVPLLKAHVMESKRIAQKVRNNGKNSRQSLNDAAMKEITALKAVLRCIEEHGLESQYPKDELTTHIDKLEKEKADRKRTAAFAPAAVPPKPQQKAKQPKQNGNKRIKAAPGPSPFIRKFNSAGAQSHILSINRPGLLLDHAPPYVSAPAGPYGLVGPVLAADPYGASSANLYGLSGPPVAFSGNSSATIPGGYSSEAHSQPGYYDNRTATYDGKGLPVFLVAQAYTEKFFSSSSWSKGHFGVFWAAKHDTVINLGHNSCGTMKIGKLFVFPIGLLELRCLYGMGKFQPTLCVIQQVVGDQRLSAITWNDDCVTCDDDNRSCFYRNPMSFLRKYKFNQFQPSLPLSGKIDNAVDKITVLSLPFSSIAAAAAAQDHVTDAAGSGNGARYRLMSPAKLPISRSTCISIPPGLSPTSFLDSPVLLSNMKSEFSQIVQLALVARLRLEFGSGFVEAPNKLWVRVLENRNVQFSEQHIRMLTSRNLFGGNLWTPVGCRISGKFPITIGLHQGSTLSLYLFALAEPSPTTGSFFKRQWTHGSGENAALLIEKNVSSGNCVDERMSSSFEFRFQTGASSTSGLSSAGLSIPVGSNRNGPVNHQDQRYSQASAPSTLASVAVGLQDASAVGSTTDELNQGHSSTVIQGSSSDHKDGVLVSAERTSDDGYNWRKYGQKLVKGSEFPRSYYKCTYPNCEVKKIFERSPSGQITEIVYKGSHDHPKPQASRRNNPGALLPIKEDKMEKDLSITDQEGKLNFNNMEQNGSPMFSPLQANEEVNDCTDSPFQGVNDDVEADDPFLKRRKMEDSLDVTSVVKPIREPRVVVQTVSDVDILDDGYRWRKYGQKVVRGNPNPRSYYKCTNVGCPVRKHVERASHDPKAVITTYEGKHNHDVPTAKNSSHEYAGIPKTRPQDSGGSIISLDLGVGIGRNIEIRTNEQLQALGDEAARNQIGRTMVVQGSQIPVCYGIVNSGLNLYGHRDNRVEDRSFQTPPIHPSNQCQPNLGSIIMGP